MPPYRERNRERQPDYLVFAIRTRKVHSNREDTAFREYVKGLDVKFCILRINLYIIYLFSCFFSIVF